MPSGHGRDFRPCLPAGRAVRMVSWGRARQPHRSRHQDQSSERSTASPGCGRTTTRSSISSATGASCSSARPPTGPTSSTGSGPASPAGSIDELGFTAVAVEADWPDAYRVNRYVMGLSHDVDANTALSDFRRFPAWMWRNRDVLAVRASGCGRATTHSAIPATKARFYGLDLYSLQASIEAVIGYLDRVDPAEARRARERYACFDHVGARRPGLRLRPRVQGRDALRERGGRAARRAPQPRRRLPAPRRLGRRGRAVLRRAERARRARRRGVLPADVPRRGVVVEPARPSHGRRRSTRWSSTSTASSAAPKVVVWEHNSHVGDARATAMGARGELNVGQLARQRYGDRLPACRLHAPTTVTSPPRRTGAAHPSASTSDPRSTGATRRCSTTSASPASGSTTAAPRRPRHAARPSPRARDRRDLPPRDRASEPLLRRPPRRPVRRGDPPGSHARARAARAHRARGTAASHPRPSRPASEAPWRKWTYSSATRRSSGRPPGSQLASVNGCRARG